MPRIRRVPLALIPLLLLPLTGCGSGTGGESKPEAAPAADGFPYTVTNCGTKTTFDAPPKRVVTMNQHVTEIMLALGLQDRLAGTAYLDDSILPEYRSAYAGTKVLAKEYPSKEVLLGANPDFVYGGYSSAFDKAKGQDRAGLQKDGINTRLNIENCAKGKVGIDQLATEITEVARTFGVPERGRKLIAEERHKITTVEAGLKGAARPSVFVYDSGDSSAFTAGGKGIGNEIVRLAGGRNVFTDLDATFGDVSWEQVIKRKPEVVVIYDYGGTTVAAKKKRLLDDPALADVPAIKNKKFAVLPLSSAVLGVRVADAVQDLAGQLHPGAR
ncbi:MULTISPECIES: ABC transporter substrate-binding protein [unclassified Streptomyces]|uniref:ABC transporter substrate-binding protein n=1 Tax=unclassified Streptomyces TaxID=2593676 RepID=UPI00380D0330